MQNNDIEMYSTHNEGKSVIAERFIRTLKKSNYKYMTSVSKNVYIKMNPVVVKSSTYIGSSKEINDKDPKFKIGDNVRASKYKNILQKVTLQISLKRFL